VSSTIFTCCWDFVTAQWRNTFSLWVHGTHYVICLVLTYRSNVPFFGNPRQMENRWGPATVLWVFLSALTLLIEWCPQQFCSTTSGEETKWEPINPGSTGKQPLKWCNGGGIWLLWLVSERRRLVSKKTFCWYFFHWFWLCCLEDEETLLHLLGECSTLSFTRLNILGSPYLSYEELGNVHWQVLLRLAKASQHFYPIWVCEVAHWACRRPQLRWQHLPARKKTVVFFCLNYNSTLYHSKNNPLCNIHCLLQWNMVHNIITLLAIELSIIFPF